MFKINDLIDLEKIPFKMILFVAILSGILFLGTDGFINDLQLADFKEDKAMYIGMVFIGCVIHIAISILYASIEKVKYYLKKKKQVKNAERKYQKTLKHLNELNKYEQSILREFCIYHSSRLYVPSNNITIDNLINVGILKKTRLFMDYHICVYLSQIVSDNIDNSRLGLANIAENQIEDFISTNRPEWVYNQSYDRLNNK